MTASGVDDLAQRTAKTLGNERRAPSAERPADGRIMSRPGAACDQHFATGEHPELLGATHAWRAMLRQAAAYLDGLADSGRDHAARTAMHDVVIHLQHACALLTAVDGSIDPNLSSTRRAHYIEILTSHDGRREAGNAG
jgi:hypothetical protein